MSDTFQRALALITVEQIFEALPLLDQVIAAQPERSEAYAQRAKIRRRLGNGQGAIADYTQALKLTPTAEIYLSRALVWLSLEQVRGAIADSREAIKLKPELAGGHRLLGKALGLLGDGASAIAAYKQAARCYLADKDKENAQVCLDAIRPLRTLPPLVEERGSQGEGEQRSAVTPEVFMARARANYERGEYAQAMKDLNWFLDFQPTHGQALCLRGLIQAQLGRREQAVADLALARQHYPDDIEVRFCRGQMRLIFKDGYGAVEEFSALIEEAGQAGKPEARFFAQRGHGYRAIEEPEKAFKDYANATAIDTENAELYELRAEMQQAVGGIEGAIADYQQAATLWLNQGNWQKHQSVVEAVRRLRKQNKTSEKNNKGSVVPIKSYKHHMPVVEVLLDGIAKFDMVIDRNATHSIVTQQMANQLNLEMVSYRYVYLADGTPMELSIGRLRSVVVGPVIVTDVYVAIAPDQSTALLGKDCFSAYSIQISGNEMIFIRH